MTAGALYASWAASDKARLAASECHWRNVTVVEILAPEEVDEAVRMMFCI